MNFTGDYHSPPGHCLEEETRVTFSLPMRLDRHGRRSHIFEEQYWVRSEDLD